MAALTPKDIREQVLERIIEVMADAESQGRNALEAAKAAFPGTPSGVINEAWAMLGFRQEENWWRAVEKTIEGELVARAIASVKKEAAS